MFELLYMASYKNTPITTYRNSTKQGYPVRVLYDA